MSATETKNDLERASAQSPDVPTSHFLSFLRHQGLFLLCILLHLALIGAHVGLIVVEFDHSQHLARDTLATDLIFLAIVMIPGAIIKVSNARCARHMSIIHAHYP